MSFEYLVGTPAGIEAFSERHEAALFTDEEYRQAFVAAGLSVEHDPEGLIGRGLYIAAAVAAHELGARPARGGSRVPCRATRRRRADRRRPVLRHDRLGAALGRRLPPAIRGRSGCRGAATGEILGLVGDIERTFWNVGSTAEPPSLPERLRALGWRDPEPPWDPVVAAMVLAEEPPAADGVEVRRIETFDDHLAGLEIMLASDAFSQEAMARERAEARQTFERRMRRGGLQWLAVARRRAGRVRDRRSEPGRPVPRRRRHAPRGAGPRVLSGSRPGALGRGGGARPARASRCRRSTDRPLRSCGGSDSSRPPPFTRSGRRSLAD